jgi:hypothetical protein
MLDYRTSLDQPSRPRSQSRSHSQTHSIQLNLHLASFEIQYLYQQLTTRMQNPQHVFPAPRGYHQALHPPNVITHAQLALVPAFTPPQIIQTQQPVLPPPTLQQYQWQQHNMTHPSATILASSQEHQYRVTTPMSAQVSDSPRLAGLQQAQAQAQAQARLQGQQQAQRASTSFSDSSGTQTRAPLRAMQPPTQLPERLQSLPASVPASSPSSSSSHPQSHAQGGSQQQQQQQQQERLTTPPAVAAFRVLQPAKALLEQTWATAISAVQHEFAVIQAEHVRSSREQKRLAELLQRTQAERAKAIQALRDTQVQLRDCMCLLSLLWSCPWFPR